MVLNIPARTRGNIFKASPDDGFVLKSAGQRQIPSTDEITKTLITGFKSPTNTGDDFNEWTNPTRAYVSDNSRASFDNAGFQQDYFDFDFGIPSGATIEGIEIKIEWASEFGTQADLTIEISHDGGTTYSSKGVIESTSLTSDIFSTWGGIADTWGRPWSQSETTNANFRMKVQDADLGAGDFAIIDHIEVKIYYIP